MISALRKGTPTTQVFWGCDDTDTGGVLGVFVDGVLTTGDTLAAADNYTGLVTVTGLSGTHSFQMALAGVAVGDTYTFQTHPSSGDDFDMLFIGDCINPYQNINLVIDREPNARCVYGGEVSYIEQILAGEPTPASKAFLDTAGNPTVYQEYLDWYRISYRGIWAKKGWMRFVNKYPGRYIWNNHEFDSGTLTAKDGECQFDAAYKAYREYEGNGNPTASDGSITVDSWPDPVVYFTEMIGDVEIICLDYTSYSENALDGQMTGDQFAAARAEGAQLTWLNAVVDASTAPFIILYLPTPAQVGGGPHLPDEWVNSPNGFLKYTLQRHTDKQVLFITANTHVSWARGIYRGLLVAHPIPEINISPLHQISRADAQMHPDDNPSTSLWAKHTYKGRADQTYPANLYTTVYTDPFNTEWIYGLIKRRPNGSDLESRAHCQIQIKDSISDKIMIDFILADGDPANPIFINRKLAVA